jgi:hypothetical protein
MMNLGGSEMKIAENVIIQHGQWHDNTKQAILTESEKQFLLYTKGHFVKGEVLYDDLKVFAAKNYGYDPEHAYMGSIVHFITQLYIGLVNAQYISTHGEKDPLQYMFNSIFKYKLKSDDDTLLRFLMSDMANVNVLGLDLGEADESYLQLRAKQAH